ncbi:5-oxoprolinase subunit B family protein [Desulfofundulus thermosubterraneus]|uniref:Allophanate hydrolase subunit 1 n=1 Tax=Desulfofundulus thermosubterraneus DSM 16057 TaxID=1121432 RepID=A0A1M6ML93_9FIRM|nr:carboxyltransferase domain-containing protein [Desulfofundulus thermosubterraneus]SHJ84194.1 Allophanate hydrolase subunit 1 [Desulfofundulus thermosubterraneus DSM 16057]
MEKDYSVILDALPEDGARPKVLFRQAGDGFLQVEYGEVPRFNLIDSFRVLTVNSAIKSKKIKGLYETVPALRTNLYHFDPLELPVEKLIAEIKEVEESLTDVENIVFESRLITLPIAFEDSETKKAVEKYVKEIRPNAPNVINGYNLEYVALCNGVTVDEVKKLVCGTEWYNSGNGFWPGGGFFWPLDPRCAIVVPKYNPPRTWTPEGAVGIGGPCLYIYPTPTGGGYQLLGRTIPIFQFSQKHPLFKDSPTFFKAGDRVRFYEVSEEEILSIYKHVHEETDYEYAIKTGKFVVKDWLSFYNSEEVQKGVKELLAKQEAGSKVAPRV